MEFVLWIVKWVIGPIVGVIVTLLVSEPLRERLAPLVSRFGSKKEGTVGGTWMATFYHGPTEVAYLEVIEVSHLFGFVVGRITPHELNHIAAQKVAWAKPLRIRGSVKDNRFFTGVWVHPNRLAHHHGAFDLIINQDNEHMSGIWLGYSESQKIIESGRWEWVRLDG
jgi:hypothetical protein